MTPRAAFEYQYVSNAAYTGELHSGKKQGKGSCTWTNGNKYVGEYKNNKREGYGVYTWSHGSTYEG